MKVSYEKYHEFSAPLEGRVPSMYCDILGLVTCGVGNLIDPISLAEQIRWTLDDGTRAPLDVVRADWHKLKSNAAYYAKRHWRFAQADTRCRMTEDEIDRVVKMRLASNEAIIKKRFPKWDDFPADAQLAIMSMAWAVGAGFYTKFPNLSRCIDAQDWVGCVASCKIREAGNPGVVPRNAKNRFCFHNAAIVKAEGSDAGVCHWPDVAPFRVRTDGASMTNTGDAVRARDEAQEAARLALALFPYEPPLGGSALRDYEADE